jgi:nucleoside diphosphate kinase
MSLSALEKAMRAMRAVTARGAGWSFKQMNGMASIDYSLYKLPAAVMKQLPFTKPLVIPSRGLGEDNAFYKAYFQNMCFVGDGLNRLDQFNQWDGTKTRPVSECKHQICISLRQQGLSEFIRLLSDKLPAWNGSKLRNEEMDKTVALVEKVSLKRKRESSKPREVKSTTPEQTMETDIKPKFKVWQYCNGKNLNVKNSAFISNMTKLPNGRFLVTVGLNMVLDSGVNELPLSFGGNMPLTDFKMAHYPIVHLLFDLQSQTATYQAAFKGFHWNGDLFTFECDEVINEPEQLYQYVQVRFDQWKNATFPKRNSNENIVRQLMKLCNGVEVESIWHHHELFDEEEWALKEITKLVAKSKPKLLGTDRFIFPEKTDWTDFMKDNSAQDFFESAMHPKIFSRSPLEWYFLLKHTLHNHKVFAFMIPYKTSCLATKLLDDLQEMYSLDKMLPIKYSSTTAYGFTSTDPLSTTKPTTIHGLPTSFRSDTGSQTSYVLIKPNGLSSQNLTLIASALDKVACVVSIYHEKQLSPAIATNLYPNCKDRPYGLEWMNYLNSGPVIHLKVQTKDIQTVRNCLLKARKQSGLIWTRNIVHTAENEWEAKNNLATAFPYSSPEAYMVEDKRGFKHIDNEIVRENDFGTSIDVPKSPSPEMPVDKPEEPELQLACEETPSCLKVGRWYGPRANLFITNRSDAYDRQVKREKREGWSDETFLCLADKTKFSLDTGSFYNFINVAAWKRMGEPELKVYKQKIPKFGGDQNIEVKGYFRCNIGTSKNNELKNQVMIVTSENEYNILGANCCENLGLIEFSKEVIVGKAKVVKRLKSKKPKVTREDCSDSEQGEKIETPGTSDSDDDENYPAGFGSKPTSG